MTNRHPGSREAARPNLLKLILLKGLKDESHVQFHHAYNPMKSPPQEEKYVDEHNQESRT